jgi:integrase
MARRLRSTKIENRTDRLNLPHRRAPHGLINIAKGARLGYRRTKKGNGTWVLEAADGKGGEWQRAVGVADDYETADGEHVLDFYQAADKARAVVRDAPISAPSTWARAIDDYEKDLEARGGAISNAAHVRYHLKDAPALLNKPVALLTAAELKRWRNDLIANSGLKASSVARLMKSARACLNLAANHDPRIQNREAWRVGLGGLHDAYQPTNRVVSDDIVRRIVAEAAALDADFGLFIRVAAETGARASQIARLVVTDLLDGAEPRLSMPSSRKGKHRAISRKPVPISRDLAARLVTVAADRAADSALLLRDGAAWDLKSYKRLLGCPFAIVAARAGVSGTTMYALRHSSVVRALLAGVPAQLVASNHDTSLQMLARTYARYIADHAHGDITRRGLLDAAAPAAPNVVALPARATER